MNNTVDNSERPTIRAGDYAVQLYLFTNRVSELGNHNSKPWKDQCQEWAKLENASLALLNNEQNLHVMVAQTRARVACQGLPSLPASLQTIDTALRQNWNNLVPQVDNGDVTERMYALAGLSLHNGLLYEIGMSLLLPDVGVFEFENFCDTRLNTAASTLDAHIAIEDAIKIAQNYEPKQLSQALNTLEAALDAAIRIENFCAEHRDARLSRAEQNKLEQKTVCMQYVSLEALIDLLKKLRVYLGRYMPIPASPTNPVPTEATPQLLPAQHFEGLPPTKIAYPQASPGPIGSREDALHALDQICAYFEHHEPSSPAPLLLKRARRLIGMEFIDIIRDLSPNSLDHIEAIAGQPAKN